MPLTTNYNFNNFKLYLWNINETEKDLGNGVLTDSLRMRLSKIKSEEFRRGILSVRHLMKVANIREDDLYYSLDGAPNLKSGENISISHSKNFSGLVISNNKIGIDIESFRKKILNISSKFLNKKEKFAIGEMDKLTFIWTAKESIYKAFRTPGISFSKQVYIYGINEKEKKAFGKLEYKNQSKLYEISYIKLGLNYITIANEKVD